MKHRVLILLFTLSCTLAAEPAADVKLWTPQHKLRLLSSITDKETADTAAELINSDSNFFFSMEEDEEE